MYIFLLVTPRMAGDTSFAAFGCGAYVRALLKYYKFQFQRRCFISMYVIVVSHAVFSLSLSLTLCLSHYFAYHCPCSRSY